MKFMNVYGVVIGEIALTLTHFKAIKTAYENGDEIALILEDDTGTELTHFWTRTPEDIVALLNREHLGEKIDGFSWSMVRLQYTLRSEYSDFYNVWKENPQHIHFLDGKDCCFGAVANLVSKRGMLEILRTFEVNHNKFDCHGGIKRYTFNKRFGCVSDKVMPKAMSSVLISTPPLFSCRFFEGTTGVRCQGSKDAECHKTNNNHLYHQQSLVTSLKWAIESRAYMDSKLINGAAENISSSYWKVYELQKVFIVIQIVMFLCVNLVSTD